MLNPVKIVFSSLLDFRSTMRLRKEAYEHAANMEFISPQEKERFKNCWFQSTESLISLEERLQEMERHAEDLEDEEKKPLKSGLYYAMAKSTTNGLTVNLSLQLGDLWLVRSFEELLSSIDFSQLKCIQEEIKRYILCLKSGLPNDYALY